MPHFQILNALCSIQPGEPHKIKQLTGFLKRTRKVIFIRCHIEPTGAKTHRPYHRCVRKEPGIDFRSVLGLAGAFHDFEIGEIVRNVLSS
jgi:hypothetical protein